MIKKQPAKNEAVVAVTKAAQDKRRRVDWAQILAAILSKVNWGVAVTSMVVALLSSLPGIIVSLRTHDAVNSRMDDVVLRIEAASLAKGKLQGVVEEKAAEADRKFKK